MKLILGLDLLSEPLSHLLEDVGAKEDTYFTFATRAEVRPNASIEFKPEDFIDDYRGAGSQMLQHMESALNPSENPTLGTRLASHFGRM